MSVVPFRKNAPDNLHCFQACLSMVLNYFLPDRPERTFPELDRISGTRPGKYTWPFHALLYLKQEGFDVIDFDRFDYRRFAEDGADYLIAYYGPEAGRDQIANSDVGYEQAAALRYAESGINRRETPTREHIASFLERGYLLLCFVDSNKLNRRRSNPTGHYVLVTRISDTEVTFHDPGLNRDKQGYPDRKAKWKLFAAAWDYGDTGNPNLIAIKRG